jgi:hypothetical protein
VDPLTHTLLGRTRGPRLHINSGEVQRGGGKSHTPCLVQVIRGEGQKEGGHTFAHHLTSPICARGREGQVAPAGVQGHGSRGQRGQGAASGGK